MFDEAVRSAISKLTTSFGKRNASFVASGMAAVEAALRITGVRSGDQVLVPVECCYTVAAAVLRAGAHPVFFDTGKALVATARDLDAVDIADARALIAVHCFGLPCNVAAVRARLPSGVAIIEDASLAFGLIQTESEIGAHSDVVIASLGERKPISLEEGGIVLADVDLSRLLDRRSGESRMLDRVPLPFPLSPLALRELPRAVKAAKVRLASRRDIASRLIKELQPLGFESVNVSLGSVPAWQRLPVWAESALRRIAVEANDAAGQQVAQLPHAIDVPDLPMFRTSSRRVGSDGRNKERLLLIRTEPAAAVGRWYSALRRLIGIGTER
jgi:hypothetical protein